MDPYDTGRATNADWRNVWSRDDLIEFVLTMRRDLLASPDEWENGSLEQFLEAFAAVVQDTAADDSLPTSGWHKVARLFVTATGYE